MTANSKFRVGDSLVVKPGVLCPDRPSLSLAGWQGWVTEVREADGMIDFDWDSLTLRAIPADYIRDSEIAGLGWQSMVLEIEEVAPATPRDKPKDAEAVYEEIMAYHLWDYLADENPGIGALLNPLGEASEAEYLSAWEKHLRQALRFPFKAELQEKFHRGPAQVGDLVEITGIMDVGDRYGLLAEVKLKGNRHVIPLFELEAVDADSPNYQPLNDYVIWSATH